MKMRKTIALGLILLALFITSCAKKQQNDVALAPRKDLSVQLQTKDEVKKENQDKERIKLDVGLYAFSIEDYHNAILLLSQVEGIYQDPSGLCFIGISFFQVGETDLARDGFDEVISQVKLHPSLPGKNFILSITYRYKAEIAFREDNYPKALEYCKIGIPLAKKAVEFKEGASAEQMLEDLENLKSRIEIKI